MLVCLVGGFFTSTPFSFGSVLATAYIASPEMGNSPGPCQILESHLLVSNHHLQSWSVLTTALFSEPTSLGATCQCSESHGPVEERETLQNECGFSKSSRGVRSLGLTG